MSRQGKQPPYGACLNLVVLPFLCCFKKGGKGYRDKVGIRDRLSLEPAFLKMPVLHKGLLQCKTKCMFVHGGVLAANTVLSVSRGGKSFGVALEF